MHNTIAYAIEINKKDDVELNRRRVEIFDYLLGLGVDPDVLLEFSAINIELAVREFKKSLGLS